MDKLTVDDGLLPGGPEVGGQGPVHVVHDDVSEQLAVYTGAGCVEGQARHLALDGRTVTLLQENRET